MGRCRFPRRCIAIILSLGLAAACSEDPFAPPPVTAGFVTPQLFQLTVSGRDAAEAPELRADFYREVEIFARDSGCTGYRVLRELFTSSANVNPRVSTDPAIVFGRRPGYHGLIECQLPPLAQGTQPTASPYPAATRPVGPPTPLVR